MRTSPTPAEPMCVNPAWRIGIVYSSYYPEVVSALRDSAVQELLDKGIHASRIFSYAAPGSFEIPVIGRSIAEQKKVDALIALGVIVEGETHHANLIATEAARGIMQVQLSYGLPFAFEILYVKDLSHARDRTDKGAEAARSVLHTLSSMRSPE